MKIFVTRIFCLDLFTLAIVETHDDFMKFAPMGDVFVCDLVATIKVCQSNIHRTYCD